MFLCESSPGISLVYLNKMIFFVVFFFLRDWNISGQSGGSLPWSEYSRESFRLSPNQPLIYFLFDNSRNLLSLQFTMYHRLTKTT